MAFLARYAHQSTAEMGSMTRRELLVFSDSVAEIMEEEADALKRSTDID